MPRRKTLEPEIVSPGGRQKIVNARHKIEYDAPVVVPDDGTEEIEPTGEDEAPTEDTERRRRHKSAKDERDELRRDMEKIGVAPANRLKLTIEKYKHSDSTDSGTGADKDYCTKYGCTKDHILNDDFLEVARKYGAGRYWLTLRLDNKIVRQWEREITLPASQNGMIMQANPNDPTSPHVVVNIPENGQPATMPDPFKEAERALTLVKKYNEAFGGFGPQGAQNGPARSEDEVLATAILKQPEMLDNVVGSLIKRFGRNGGGDDDPSPWAVAMKLVESGQASQIVKAFLDSFWNGINNFRGNQNGQATMAQTPHAQNNQIQGPPLGNGQADQFRVVQNIQAQPASAENPSQAGPDANGQQMSPEQEALALVLNHCQRQAPPRMTLAELTQREQTLQGLINQHAMQTGQILTNQITLYLDLFNDMTTDEVMEIVKSLPGGAEIVALPHAREWTEQLQKLIQESNGGDEE